MADTWDDDPRFDNPYDRGIDRPRDAKAFLGVGWKFPPQLDARGRIALVSHEDDIDEAILIILRTRPGERPMRPRFGSDLYRLLFASVDQDTANRAQMYVTDALEMWEPRIELRDVRATPHPQYPSALLIHVDYVVRSTNSERNLVAPFFLIPDERE